MDSLQVRVAKLNELREGSKPDGIKDAQALGYSLFMYRDSIDASNDALNEAMALLQSAGEALEAAEAFIGYSAHVPQIKMRAGQSLTKLRNAGVIV